MLESIADNMYVILLGAFAGALVFLLALYVGRLSVIVRDLPRAMEGPVPMRPEAGESYTDNAGIRWTCDHVYTYSDGRTEAFWFTMDPKAKRLARNGK